MTTANLLRRATLATLLSGIVLRALIPLGYMPAASGSGLLFVLCPDQLPGLAMPAAHSAHVHGDGKSAQADACDFGHLMSAAAITEVSPEFGLVAQPQPAHAVRGRSLVSIATRTGRHARAPPA